MCAEADVGVELGVGVVAFGVVVGPVVGVGVSVGTGVGVGPDEDGLLNAILGLWLFGSVMVNPVVVSCTSSVTVPFICDDTVKFPWPFCTENVCGDAPPFICALVSPELTETCMVSEETALLLQSRRITNIC